jgi:hypothetical protein
MRATPPLPMAPRPPSTVRRPTCLRRPPPTPYTAAPRLPPVHRPLPVPPLPWFRPPPPPKDGPSSSGGAGVRRDPLLTVFHLGPGPAGRPLFRDVLLLQRAPPVPAPCASSPREPSPLETVTSSPHHKERHRRFRGLERAPETTLDGGWTRVESRNSKKRRLRALRARRPVPGDLVGRCFNCLAEDHLAASCRLGPRCFRCKALGHRSYICPGPVNGDKIFPVLRRRLKGAVWSRLSTVAPANVVRGATGPVSQHQLAQASVWERLVPPAPRPCVKTCVSVWRRISPPGVEKGQAHFERMNGAVDARAIVTPSSDVGAAAASASQGSLPPATQTPSKAQVIP